MKDTFECIYLINCPGHLFNFWPIRVGANSRVGAYYSIFPKFSKSEDIFGQNKG